MSIVHASQSKAVPRYTSVTSQTPNGMGFGCRTVRSPISLG